MKILVTGAKGFAGRNLVENLKNIRNGKNKTRPNITIEEIFEYDIDSTPAELDEYCAKADFVFNLAGVNRPTDPGDFKKGNRDFAETLLETLKNHNSKAYSRKYAVSFRKISRIGRSCRRIFRNKHASRIYYNIPVS